MPRLKGKPATTTSTRRTRPPLTVEAQENRMISMAMDLAEQQLRDGTASSQVITHFLKLGSTKERLEKEILVEQKDLVKAKAKSLRSTEELKELYTEALRAFRSYSPEGGNDDED